MSREFPKLRMAYFATPEFSVPTLEVLHHHPQVDLLMVVSQLSKPSGRGHQIKDPAVIEYAKIHKIPFSQTSHINKDNELLVSLEKCQLDLIVVLAFSQFLSAKILSLPKLGAFNIHTSLLPKFRGASPIQHAIINGESETGVTIQKMVKKMDAGEIVFRNEIDLTSYERASTLSTRLKFSAALSVFSFLDKVLNNQLTYTPQDESAVTFAPLLSKDDGFLDFKNFTVRQIIDKVRGLHPWPGTYCFLNKKRIKVLEITSYSGHLKILPGEVNRSGGHLLVGCQDGAARLATIQLEGKKPSTDTDLLNGWKENNFQLC